MWLLMPSGLLVRQIPYREMLSLGLKVRIRRRSCLLCLVLCGLLGLVATRSWSVPSLTRRRVLLGREMLSWATALLSDGLLDCTHPSVLRAWCVGAHGESQMYFTGRLLPVPCLRASLIQ